MYPYYIRSVNLYKAFKGKPKKQAGEGCMQCHPTCIKGFGVRYFQASLSACSKLYSSWCTVLRVMVTAYSGVVTVTVIMQNSSVIFQNSLVILDRLIYMFVGQFGFFSYVNVVHLFLLEKISLFFPLNLFLIVIPYCVADIFSVCGIKKKNNLIVSFVDQNL